MIDIVALVMARNAGETLDRFLSHLGDADIPVIVIDHGSTDATWEIARARWKDPVAGLVREPFTGAFSLTRQLAVKADLIGSLTADWVLHLDADEFLYPPDPAEPLRAFIARQAATGADAISADEFLFLPTGEDDAHSAATFPETMQNYVPFAPRNPKQRAFRRGADLSLWQRTGGHSITRDPSRIAPERFGMRHYAGLSMDHLRRQYVSRVFAGEDLAKGWHTTRSAGAPAEITSPGALLRPLGPDGPDHVEPLSDVPFLSPGRLPSTEPLPDADYYVAGTSHADLARVAEALAHSEPAARIARLDTGFHRLVDAGGCVVHVVSDGRKHCGDAPRDDATRWCQAVAALRQVGQVHPNYVELRAEDPLADLPRRTGLRRFPPLPGPETASQGTSAFEAVARDLLADLGYSPTTGSGALPLTSRAEGG